MDDDADDGSSEASWEDGIMVPENMDYTRTIEAIPPVPVLMDDIHVPAAVFDEWQLSPTQPSA